MNSLLSLPLALSALLVCAPLASAEDLKVTIESPASGAAITSCSFVLEVRVQSKETVESVEVVQAFKKERVVAILDPFAKGRWRGSVPVSTKVRVRVRDVTGGVAYAETKLKNHTGWSKDVSTFAPGAPVRPSAELVAIDGSKLKLEWGEPTLVVFYSSWKGCEAELNWIRSIRKRFAGKSLRVIGVGSVPPTRTAEWAKWLHKRGANWTHVLDVPAIRKPFRISERFVAGNEASYGVAYFVMSERVHGGDLFTPDTLSDPKQAQLRVLWQALERALR